MQKLVLFLLLFASICKAQVTIEAVPKSIEDFRTDHLFDIDNFGNLYFSKSDNTLYKQTKDTTITYTNFQLGKITSVNSFNPLKLNLFYADFNTVIILDNRLAEIFKIDFNVLEPYRNVSFVTTGYDNTLWLFNQDFQFLELYDYKTNKTRIKTVPVQSKVLDLDSDYNYVYLLTENYLYLYNYFGSLITKYPNLGYDSLTFGESNLLLKKENELYIMRKNSDTILPLKLDDLLINQFFVTNETLYIYTDGKLRQFQLKTR
ncbi:MAG: hypothetical protein KJO96_10345 [Winogradskyella sp.]|nr:hypothetical protein [Winogradskyella sp.]